MRPQSRHLLRVEAYARPSSPSLTGTRCSSLASPTADPFYRALGKEAISEWRTNPLYAPYYHETGVLFHSGHDNPAAADYMTQGVKNGSAPEDVHLERPATGNQLPRIAHLVQSPREGQNCFPEPLRQQLGPFAQRLGTEYPSYFNPRGGWAEARNATVAALAEAKRLGAKIVGEAEVAELLTQDSGRVVAGVKTNDGRCFYASGGGSVIICAGSWTTKLLDSKLLPAVKLGPLGEPASTSGQTVITVQLNEQQRKAFRGAPVTFNLKTGFYTFEPDAEGVLKAAIHGPGYTNPAPPLDVPASSITYPSFPSSAGASQATLPTSSAKQASRAQTMGGRNAPFEPTIQTARDEHIPANKEHDMFRQLLEVYPALDETVDTLRSRVCWYSDTADENWIIDAMPLKNLVIATGDSGHGFKVSGAGCSAETTWGVHEHVPV